MASGELERFIAENFDSEESVVVLLALRESRSALTAGEVLTRVELSLAGPAVAEERRLAEKRIELRLRDLVGHGLIERDGNRYRYRADAMGAQALVENVADIFEHRRAELDRIIYSAGARARRLAEAFRL